MIVNKVDEDGNPVKGAEFTLQQKVYANKEDIPSGADGGSDEKGAFYWKEFKANLVSGNRGQITITNMPVGSYRFIETKAPEGYVLIGEPQYFSIEKAGQIKEIDGVYKAVAGSVEELKVLNPKTAVKIRKVDEKGKQIAGARLVVKSADGRKIDGAVEKESLSFTTTEEPYELKGLPAGDYLLCEVEAPEGYRIAADVPFTVKEGSDAVVEVTMVDQREEKTEITPTPEPGTNPGSGTDSTPGTSYSGGSQPKTGDNTPIAWYAGALLLAAGAVILILIFIKKRNK